MLACLTGSAPPAADQRLDKDEHVPARRIWGAKCSTQLLATIDWCLRLDHLERPQSVLELQKALLRERDPVVAEPPTAFDVRGMLLKLASWRDGR
jgi:hypothetical protein